MINVHQWYTIVITQFFESTFYKNTIKIDDKILQCETNEKMDTYENIIIYISHPDFNNIDGSIKNLFIINGITNSSKQNVFVLPADIANKDADFINYKQEFSLLQNTFLGTLRVIEMEFVMFFNIKPTKYTKGLKSVLHLILDEDLGASSSRNLAVLFHKDGSGKLSIFAGLNGNANYYIETPALKLFEWSSVKISQIYLENKFWLLVDLNEENIYKAENIDASVFNNIKVYASDPWNTAQQCSINDLLIINGKVASNPVGIIPTQIKRGKIIAEKLTLEKEHFISFDLKSNEFFYRSTVNVISFYCQTNNGFVIYDFFFQYLDSRQLRISSIYGPDNFDNLSPFEFNSWSNVEVARFLKGNSYTFTIRINGKLYITQSVNNVSSYDNVSVFASRDGFVAHAGSIKNMLIINGISNTSQYQRKSKFSTSTKTQTDYSTIIIGITAPLSIIFIIITGVLIKMYRKKKIQKSLWKINYMESNLKDFNDLSKDKWEIFPGSITLEKKIGEGAFGNVFIGKMSSNFFSKTNQRQESFSFLHINNELITNVAVKLLKDGANQSEFDDFREEINLMKEIRYHKNIVNMIGCSTIKKPLCLIVEFMENGDLLNFLRNRRTKLFASKVDGESANTFMYTERYQQCLETKKSENSTTAYVNDISFDEVEQLLPDDLLSFAWQVASGMEFLSCNKLVHRDLAARNILVGCEKNVKISDFGLTRKINDDLNYMGSKNRRLPVKWMSVEAIFDQIFTSCSDVWAFGVVLFEIVTLGGTPYPSISNRELLTLLKSGYRMDRPENCSEIMYDMMLHCWNENPLKRPTFTELREHFDKIISQGDSYFSFDVKEQSNYYKAASFNSLPSETTDDVLDKEILEKPLYVKSIEEIKNRYNDPIVVLNEIFHNRETCNPQTELNLPVGLTNNTFNESLSEI